MRCIMHNLTNSAIACAFVILVGNAHAQQFPIPQTATEVPGPAPGTAMTKAYVPDGRNYPCLEAGDASASAPDAAGHVTRSITVR